MMISPRRRERRGRRSPPSRTRTKRACPTSIGSSTAARWTLPWTASGGGALLSLDGYSRTMLAGAIAPAAASWVTLMVLYTACLRYGAPQYLISDSGGAFTSHDVTAVLKRLAITPNPLVSTHGDSYKNLLETHFNIGF